MKKLFCLCFGILLAACFCSCNRQGKAVGATEDEAFFPVPAEYNYVESEGATQLRYDMTLWDYTTAFNLMYSDLGGGNTEGISFSDWTLLKKNEKDDSGVRYNYYYYSSGKIVLTATVEAQSQQVVNLGCGTTVEVFNTDAADRQETMTLCGIMAAVAGGYESDAVTFFDNLFADTVNSGEKCFWYRDSIYMLSTEKGGDSKESTMLFRTMPASEKIRDKWNLQDYVSYRRR